MKSGKELRGLNVVCDCGQWIPVVEMASYMEGIRRVRELYQEVGRRTTLLPKREEYDELIEFSRTWARELTSIADLYQSFKEENQVDDDNKAQ